MSLRRSKNTIERVFRQMQQERGYTQADIAALVGVTQSAISRWMRGERVPRQRRIRQQLLQWGVDPQWL